tara:strand:- start:1185 stop:1304 length:120 start_codon:yes stop_codon:yes gene_type:complete
LAGAIFGNQNNGFSAVKTRVDKSQRGFFIGWLLIKKQRY